MCNKDIRGDTISVQKSLTYLSVEVKICPGHGQNRPSNSFSPSGSSPCVVTSGSVGTESEMLGVFQTQGCHDELCFGAAGEMVRGEQANRVWL